MNNIVLRTPADTIIAIVRVGASSPRVKPFLVVLVLLSFLVLWSSVSIPATYAAEAYPGTWDARIGAPGMDGASGIAAIVTDRRGNTYVTGGFTTIGGIPADNIARWDGARWWPLGGGLNGWVEALALDSHGNLYASYNFQPNTTGAAPNSVARWDGTTWTELGTGMNNRVYTLAVDANDTLFAAGSFWIADGAVANKIARWDGARWVGVGGGVDGCVEALAIDRAGRLYAGGHFTVVEGMVANNVARWDGTGWSALGGGTNATVYSLAVDGRDQLYAGGIFETADGVAAKGIARWDGVRWSPLGPGVPGEHVAVTKLTASPDGTVYAGGYNIALAGTRGLVGWDGAAWAPVGGGTNHNVSADRTLRGQ